MIKDYKIKIDDEILDWERSRKDSPLGEAKSIGEGGGIEVKTYLIEQEHGPAVDVVKLAEKNGFKHIIVGSHGGSGISRIALGSVAEGIVEKARCIVTAVRCEWPP